MLLLFTAYQIWGTSIQEAHTQSALRTQLQQETNSQEIRHALAEESALDKLPTGPPVAAPRTSDPAEGEPIGDIRIPVIGINQVVVEGINTPDLRKGPGHYIGTPLPGESGNAAIAGHRTTYGHPFYNLDSVKVGDPIVLTTLQGIFVYDATKSFVVSPSDTSVIKNVFADMLTLTTCNPRFSASTRLIVQAELAHSQLFPNSGLHTAALHADPKSGDLAGNSNVELTDALFWGFVTVVVGAGILVAATGSGADAGRSTGWVPSACWSCSGSSSGPSARCSPPASSGHAGRATTARSLQGLRRRGRTRRRHDLPRHLPGRGRQRRDPGAPRRGPAAPAPPAPRCWPRVHFLLLSGADALASHYDTVAEVRGIPFDRSGDVTAAFADFCRAYRPELTELIATRTTQTNEVGRCTALMPGLCHIASLYDWEEPLSVLDLGTSAGLNLLFDDYSYTYRAAVGDGTRRAGAAGSAVALECSGPRRRRAPA